MKTKKQIITAKPNFKNRTFTIRVHFQDGTITKYRTIKLSKEEFESQIQNTKNDWKQFLKTDDYYKV